MNVPALLATYQLRQREYLLHITRAMTSRLELPSLLTLILNSAADLVSCQAGLIVLVRDESSLPAGDVPTGEPEIDTDPFEIRATYAIPDELLPAFQPLLDFIPATTVDNAQGENRAVQTKLRQRVNLIEEQLGMTLGEVVWLPLFFEHELLGLIYLFRSEHAFTELDSEFLAGFAYQAAIAVRNAKLYHQLENERSRLAMFVEKSTSGIMIMDANRRVELINQPLAELLGITVSEAVGQPCQAVLSLENVTGDDLCDSEDYITLLTKDDMVCEGEINRLGRKQVIVSLTYTPLYDDEQRLVNIIAIAQDITRFREEEETKNTFTSIISHELKTPVAIIKGYAQTLARPDAEWDSRTARNGLQIIEEEADRLESLINNLLDVSRIQASGLKLDYSYVDMVSLVTKVAEAYHTQSQHHRIEIDLPKDFPDAWGDDERLRQVLTNLIGNAIKYSPNGGVIRIGGWVDETPEHVVPGLVLYVADEGIGIPQEELPHIFDRYYRVDSSLRRKTTGAGLGLFLCKAIIEAHQGQIWARSEPNGTTFFFSIPIYPAKEEPTSWTIVKA
ncbi:MAG: ATP-binding protein [Chloroflexota bacterium]